MTATPPPAPSPSARALVEAYLTDLRASLSGLEAGEREEVVLMVREHIDVALAHRPGATAHDVAEVITALGPPERIAEQGPSVPPAQMAAPVAAPPAATPVTAEQAAGAVGALLFLVGAVLSVPLLLVNPFIAVALAVICLIGALVGIRGTSGSQRRRYRWAIGVSTGFLLVLAVLASSALGLR